MPLKVLTPKETMKGRKPQIRINLSEIEAIEVKDNVTILHMKSGKCFRVSESPDQVEN